MSFPEFASLETPPRVTLGRLRNAVVFVRGMQGEELDRWLARPDFYLASHALHVVACERDLEQYERTPRDNLALRIGGLIMTTHWMFWYPRRGVPCRENIEGACKLARFPESAIVSPLVNAYADDPEVTLSDSLETRIRNTATFQGLEQILEEFGPTPDDLPPDWPEHQSAYYDTPITCGHVASVMRPLVAELTGQLLTMDPKILSRKYLNDLDEQISNAPWLPRSADE